MYGYSAVILCMIASYWSFLHESYNMPKPSVSTERICDPMSWNFFIANHRLNRPNAVVPHPISRRYNGLDYWLNMPYIVLMHILIMFSIMGRLSRFAACFSPSHCLRIVQRSDSPLPNATTSGFWLAMP